MVRALLGQNLIVYIYHGKIFPFKVFPSLQFFLNDSPNLNVNESFSLKNKYTQSKPLMTDNVKKSVANFPKSSV